MTTKDISAILDEMESWDAEQARALGFIIAGLDNAASAVSLTDDAEIQNDPTFLALTSRILNMRSLRKLPSFFYMANALSILDAYARTGEISDEPTEIEEIAALLAIGKPTTIMLAVWLWRELSPDFLPSYRLFTLANPDVKRVMDDLASDIGEAGRGYMANRRMILALLKLALADDRMNLNPSGEAQDDAQVDDDTLADIFRQPDDILPD